MTIELGRRLLSSGAVSADDVHAALFAHVTGNTHFLHALILRGAVGESSIDREVAHAGLPTLAKVVPNLDLVARLPLGLCATLLAVPVRVDPFSQTVDVAAADPFDSHVPSEFGFHLQAPIRVVHARVSLIDEAIDSIARSLGEGERVSQPFALDSALQRSNTPAFGSVAAAIALQAARRSSDMPIPLVRRSKAPQARLPSTPPASDIADDDAGRITRDAIVLDPGAIAAAARHAPSGDVAHPANAPIPQPPRAPHFPADNESPLLDAMSLEEALIALEHSTSRDAVVHALIRGMRACAGRVAVFAVRRDAFAGWACTPAVASAVTFRSVSIPREPPSALADAASRGWFLGVLSDSEADRVLAALLDPPSDEVAILAVRLSGRTAMLVVADQLTDAMIATRTAERLTRSAAAALVRILRTDKLQGR